MDRYSYRDYGSSCLQGGIPPCSAACPLNLDIREIEKKIQKGKFSAAYRLLRDKVVFPAIVCKICSQPCKQKCLRNAIDDPIELRMLEQACVDYTTKKNPLKINLPPREEQIAIIGGGLTGLACAYLLALRKYKVTVYEKNNRIGGQLWELLAEEDFIPEIEEQIKEVDINIITNKEIHSLAEVGADAVLISSGKDGDTFCLGEGYSDRSFGTSKPGIFIAGSVIGADPVLGIGQASVVAHSIEAYLQIGTNDGKPASFIKRESQIDKDMSKFTSQPAVKPQNSNYYSQEEAKKEAGRCILCDCTECEDCCELFHYYKKNPRALATEAVVDLGDTLISSQTSTHRMASCNLCGLCGKVCPQDIDMGRLYYDFRHFKHDDKAYFDRFNDYFLRDMEHANNEAALIKPPPGGGKASRLFFPGCQIGAGSPATVSKAYKYLLDINPKTAIMLHCCGIPADWAGDSEKAEESSKAIRTEWMDLGEPEIILACTSCMKQLSKIFPEDKLIMVYDVIETENIAKSKLEWKGRKVSVFDPCSSRELNDTQESVRKILSTIGAEIEELEYSSEVAQCCGWGGHTAVANPELTNEMIDNRINKSDNEYIVYCSNCRDNFLTRGKECVHILDILFDISVEKPVTIRERRDNRILLRRDILRSIFMENTKAMPERKKKLLISDEVQKQIDSKFIAEDDIEFVIDNCESENMKTWNPDRKCYTAHMKKGILTYWVDYKIKDSVYEIINAYYHRIEIIE